MIESKNGAEFYKQLQEIYKLGVDPSTNLLKSEVKLLDDAIGYIKFRALNEAAIGKTELFWLISQHSVTVIYRNATGNDVSFKVSELAKLLGRSDGHLEVFRDKMKQEFRSHNVYYTLNKDDRDLDFIVTLAWWFDKDEVK